MKKNCFLYMSIMFIVNFAFFSCTNEIIENQEEKQSDPKCDFVELLLAKGYNLTNLIEAEDFFIVEGDIKVQKDNLIKGYNTTRQARFDYTVSLAYRYDIKIKLDSSLPAGWKDAFISAISKWNSFNGLYMRDVSNTSLQPDITIFPNYLDQKTIALASEPLYNGKPGKTIEVNTVFANSYNSGQKLLISVHELGHCIGLRHTNWMSNFNDFGRRLEPDAIGIDGTPNTGSNPDPNSIMNFNIAGRSWSDFSYYDKIAVNSLYSTPSISFPNQLCVGESGIITFHNLPSSATVKWVVDDLDITKFSHNTWDVCNASYEEGLKYVEATINIPNKTPIKKRCDIYAYGMYISNAEILGSWSDFSFHHRDGSLNKNFNWRSSHGEAQIQGYDWTCFDFHSSDGGYVEVICDYTNACGNRMTVVKYFQLY